MDTWQLRVAISFILSGAIFILLTALPLPGNEVSYIMNPELHQGIRQAIWWGCGIVVFVYFIRQSTDNVLGTFMCAIMGPVSLLTMFFVWISVKIFPGKNLLREVDEDDV